MSDRWFHPDWKAVEDALRDLAAKVEALQSAIDEAVEPDLPEAPTWPHAEPLTFVTPINHIERPTLRATDYVLRAYTYFNTDVGADVREERIGQEGDDGPGDQIAKLVVWNRDPHEELNDEELWQHDEGDPTLTVFRRRWAETMDELSAITYAAIADCEAYVASLEDSPDVLAAVETTNAAAVAVLDEWRLTRRWRKRGGRKKKPRFGV